ncbi:UNVERIFIED_CONTAM: Twinkle protein [Trichonephila clavipes]
MNFISFGRKKWLFERILQALENAASAYRIQHLVVDNLQYMMNMEEYNTTLDQFRRQEQIFGYLREFANRRKCHVTLVIHPRKDDIFLKNLIMGIFIYRLCSSIANNLLEEKNMDQNFCLHFSQAIALDDLESADLNVVTERFNLKEPEFTELNNTSISGTAKAIQEADNILILQTTKTRQYLQVSKNRYDGDKGCVIVEFDKKSLTFNMKQVNEVKR